MAAVNRAGEILLLHLDQAKEIHHKGRGNIVTEVDLLVEKEVVALLQGEFPGHGILAEESTPSPGSTPWTWVIDPLDGTRNYASGIPFFAVNLALAREEEVLLGLTYDPVRKELFSASKGGGAFLNGQPLHVSDKTTVQASVMGFDMGYHNERARQALELIVSLWPGMQSIRVMGSAALGLAYAACGRLDLYFHHNLAPWDLASGLLLVAEAGGTITDRLGQPVSLRSDGAIAANPTLHADFRHLSQGHPWGLA